MLKKQGINIMKAMTNKDAFDITDAVEAFIVLMGRKGIKSSDLADNDATEFIKYGEYFMQLMEEMFGVDDEYKDNSGNGGE